MKIKKYYLSVSFRVLFIALLCFFANYAECVANTPEIDASLVGPKIVLKSDSKAHFNIRIVIQKDHHAYLDKGDDGFFIPIEFDFTGIENAGYECKIEEGPEGEREDKVGATVLRGENTYSFSIEGIGHSQTSSNFQIKFSYQLCNDISNICYPPATASVFIPIGNTKYNTKLSHEGTDTAFGLDASAKPTTQEGFED